jgi:hypothetical protein
MAAVARFGFAANHAIRVLAEAVSGHPFFNFSSAYECENRPHSSGKRCGGLVLSSGVLISGRGSIGIGSSVPRPGLS